jgi:hypothetical protein
MKVIADFGKIEGAVLRDYVNEVELLPGHPITPVYVAVKNAFRRELRRRQKSSKRHRPARGIDLPLDKLSPDSLLELQDRVSALTKLLWPREWYYAAQFFQSIGFACRELIMEKLERHTLH